MMIMRQIARIIIGLYVGINFGRHIKNGSDFEDVLLDILAVICYIIYASF